MSEKVVYKVEDVKEGEILFPFWEVPSFVGNNLRDMLVCQLAEESKGFYCNVEVRKSKTEDKPLKFRGLFDTGASRTCISQHVIDTLKPEKNGQSGYTVFEGSFRLVDKYRVDVFVEDVNAEFQINALSAPGNDRGIDVIIGLDIIELGELLITKVDGKLVLKFDTPVLPNK